MIDELLEPSRWTWLSPLTQQLAAPFEEMSWWEIANAPIIGTVVSSTVGIYLALRVQQVTNDSRAATDAKIEEERAEAEIANAASPTSGAGEEQSASLDAAARTRFQEAASEIHRLKSYVDVLAERVRDGRTRRKYSNIGRRDYRVIATAIHRDGGLSDADAQKLVSAFNRWRTYKNGKIDVPVTFAEELRKLSRIYQVSTTQPKPWRPVREAAVASSTASAAGAGAD